MIKTARSKTPAIILAFIVILIGAGILVYKKYKYRVVQQKLEQAVDPKGNGIYRLEYDHLAINEVAGSIDAENIRLHADTAAYRRLHKNGPQPPILISLSVPRLSITGVKTPKALLTSEIDGGKILLDHAVLEIFVNNYFKGSSEPKDGPALYREILGNLKSVHIGVVSLEHTTVIITDLLTHKNYFKGSDFSLQLDDLAIDSLHSLDSSRFFFAKEVTVVGKQLQLPWADHLYKLALDDFSYSSSANRFTAARFQVIPQLGEAAFAKKFKNSQDRYDIDVERVAVTGIDRKALLRKQLAADSVLIGKSSFKIYRDISIPHDSIIRIGAYPQQKLQQLELPLYLRKISVRNTFIEYKERNGKSDTGGKVQFFDVQAVLSNMTNMPSRMAENGRATLDFHARFLNKAAMHAVMTMYLQKHDGTFDLRADLGPMDATDLNPMIEPMALARVDKGRVDALHLSLRAGDRAADGKLLFLYKDLKISLLKRKENSAVYKKKFLPSLAAGILVKESNPKGGEKRVSAIHYKRDVYKSMFNLMWKSLFTGIKETVGVQSNAK